MKQGLVAALLFACGANAATYYVDQTQGRDANSGTSPAAAWKSLARLQRARFQPGDYILLKRGGVWHEQLPITASGAAGEPITFGAYGSGGPPAIDGQGVTIPEHSGLVAFTKQSHVAIDGLEIRNSAREGMAPYLANDLAIRHVSVHHNQYDGLLVFDGNNVAVENSEFYANCLNGQSILAGIRIDGSGAPQSGFIIANNRIHDHVGGEGWWSGNGIYLGHTGPNIPTLRNVTITGNEIYRNGNPNQNQAGRGISGSFHGDVAVTRNHIYRNASAGLYLGDRGLTIAITISENVFVDNALRQFGGFTDGRAEASHNLVYVDDPKITAMGAEIGGNGPWTLRDNVFSFTTPTNDVYRGFIRINNPEQDKLLDSDHNVFYSAGPKRWKRSDGAVLSFERWRAAGYDAHSICPN